MGGLLAEILASRGLKVTLVTPAGEASTWTRNTVSRERVNKRLSEIGVTVVTNNIVRGFSENGVDLTGVYDAAPSRIPATSLVTVTARIPNDGLYYDLMADEDALCAAGIKSVTRVGDSLAPGSIAAAVHSGHGFAQDLDEPDPGDLSFKREKLVLEPIHSFR